MDLGTIKKRITDRKYKNIKSIDDDVKLVWTNCTTYNADGSDFFILAQNLNKKWVDKFTKFCNDFHLNPVDGTSTKASENTKKNESGGASSSQSGGAGAGSSSNGGPLASSSTNNNNSSTTATTSTNNNVANNPNSKTSLEEKRSFARSLYKISKEDLGRVLVEVELKCPAALTKNSSEDEVEFNVDKLMPQVFQELVVFVKNCPSMAGGSNSSSANAANGTAGSGSTNAAAVTAGGDANAAGNNPAISNSKSKKKSSSSSGGTKRQKT